MSKSDDSVGEVSVRLPNLSFKKSLFIFFAAVAVIHFAFYLLPRYSATRPRFDEAAYNEAVALLKEEVGAAADAGVITIPRVPVACPYYGELFVVGFDPDRDSGIFLDFRGGETRLILHTGIPNEPGRPPEARMARLERDQARRIWDTLYYLSEIEERSDWRVLSMAGVAEMKLADRTWPKGRVSWCFGGRGNWSLFEADAGGRAVGRYVRSLLASNAFAWTGDRGEIEAAFIDTLRRTLSSRDEDEPHWVNDGWMRHAESYLLSFASAKARPFFMAQYRKSMGFGGWLERAPLVGRFFRPSENAFGTGYPWVFDTLSRMSPEEQLATVSSTAFDPKNPYKGDKSAAMWFLCRHWPQEYRRLCIERFKQLGIKGGWEYLGYYKEACPGDTTLADIISRDSGIDDDPQAFVELYRLTSRHEFIDRLMQYALRSSEGYVAPRYPDATTGTLNLYFLKSPIKSPFDVAAVQLGRIYSADRSQTDIPEFLFKHARLAKAASFIGVLAGRGSPEDRQFLVSVALNEIPEFAALPPDAVRDLRLGAILPFINWPWSNKSGLMDEAVAERFVRYLEPRPEPAADESLYVNDMIAALAGVKSQRALDFVEKICAEDDSTPEGAARASYVSTYKISRQESAPLYKSLMSLRVRCAASPIDALLALKAPSLALRDGEVVRALADEYSEGDLESFLAESEYESIRGLVYSALVAKREAETRK